MPQAAPVMHSDATSSTCRAQHSATVTVDRIALIHSLQPWTLPNLPKRGLTQRTLTATNLMVLMMVSDKIIRMEVFLITQFGTIWVSGNKDKAFKRDIILLSFVF